MIWFEKHHGKILGCTLRPTAPLIVQSTCCLCSPVETVLQQALSGRKLELIKWRSQRFRPAGIRRPPCKLLRAARNLLIDS
jgi:hypothetical protein